MRKISVLLISLGFLFVLSFALLILHLFSGPSSDAQSPSQVPAHVQDEIIVKFRKGVPEPNKELASFKVLAVRMKVFKILEGLELLKLPSGLSVEEAIEIYQQDPDVLYAEPNYIVTTTKKPSKGPKSSATNTPNDPSFNDQWGFHNTGLNGGTPDADIDGPEAWDNTTGSSGVVVGVIDTGIDYNHRDLSDNMFRNSADCNNNGIDDDGNGFIDDCHGIDTANGDSDPMDDHGHGTHVSGTIGAVGDNNIGVVGVNWTVRLMGCKFLDASGSGSIARAIDCLEYFKTMKDRGVNIVATSNSWGGGGFSQALLDAIDVHRQRGILFITAAGNGNLFGIGQNNDLNPFYPCNTYLPNVICVAATTRTDARSSFSNFGRRTVHIGAPGSEILSTSPGNSYSTSSGTSMATPHMTGVAALLKAQNSSWDWRSIKNRILAGGDNVTSMTSTVTQKRLNANGAVACSNSTVLSRLRPIGNTINGSVGTPIDLAACTSIAPTQTAMSL